MKRKALLLALLAVFVFAGQYDASAMHHGGKSYCLKSKFFNKYDFMMKHRKELELSEEQMTGLKNIKYTVKKAKVEAKAAGKMAYLDATHEIYQGEGNLEALYSIMDQELEAKRKLKHALVKGLLDFNNLLSSGQKKTLKELWYDEKYSDSDCESCGHCDKGHKQCTKS